MKSGNKLLRRWAYRVLRFAFIGIGLFVAAGTFTLLLLRWVDPPTTAFMLWNNAAESSATRYEWRDRAGLGDMAALAVMAAEDQRFPEHSGLDLDAISNALDGARSGGRLRGASTISQQLVKNLFLWPGRSLARKGLEAGLAILLELLVPKNRILELYLNTIELGRGIYGVPAASRIFFGVEPAQLTLAQAALLAAVLPNPLQMSAAQPSDYVLQRQAWIVAQAVHLRDAGWLRRIDW